MNNNTKNWESYPVRKCRSRAILCRICGKQIPETGKYYDGGPGNRAHFECVTQNPDKSKAIPINVASDPKPENGAIEKSKRNMEHPEEKRGGVSIRITEALDLEGLSEQAKTIIRISNLLDSIMAGLMDAYNNGFEAGMDAGKTRKRESEDFRED